MKTPVAVTLVIVGALLVLVPAMVDRQYQANRTEVVVVAGAPPSLVAGSLGAERYLYSTLGVLLLVGGIAGSWTRNSVRRVVAGRHRDAA